MNAKEKAQKEILDSLEYKPHGVLYLAPRMGKTKLVIELIKRDKPESILWVTPFARLAEVDIPKEFETWNAKKYLKKLTTSTYKGLQTLVGFYDMVILDEIQHLTPLNSQNLLKRSIDYIHILGMTGTPTRHEEKLQLYRDLELKLFADCTIEDAVEMNILPDHRINVVKIPLDERNNILVKTAKTSFYTSEKKQYEYLSKNLKNKFSILNRMRAIHNSPSKERVAKILLEKLEGRKLIFTANKTNAKKLSNNVYHSTTSDKYLEQFEREEIDHLVLVNKGGTGYTYRNVPHLIACQLDSDNNGLSSQKLCRILLKADKDCINDMPTLWILCLEGTKDEDWVKSTLRSFDNSRIKEVSVEEIENM